MVDYERAFKLTKCYEHYRDWSRLPADILGDISSRLFFEGYVSFANVCTSWRSAKAPLSPRMPLLFLRKNHFSPKPFCKLLNITDNLSNNIRMPILGGKVCIGSQDGWLFLVDNTVHVISLYNPFSKQEIKLHSHAHIVTWLISNAAVSLGEFEILCNSFSIRKVVLSCAPNNSTAPCPAASALLDNGYLMFKKDGEYGWRLLLSNPLVDITCWRGKFVGVMRTGYVHQLDLDMPELKFECICSRTPYYVPASYSKHIVTLNNSLLLVLWLYASEERRIITFKIWKLDLRRHTWIPIDDLCSHSLFLGSSHSFSLPSQRIPGLKDNLIYIIEDLWGNDIGVDMTNWKRDVGVFDMRTGTYEICPLPNTILPRSTSAFWYVPPLSELQKEILSCNEADRN